MIKALTSIYQPRFARTIVYMLQATEYQLLPYLKWFWRTSDFSRVMHRRQLVMTGPARWLLLAMQTGLLLQYAAGVVFLIWATDSHSYPLAQLALTLIIIAPIVWGHLIIIPLLLGRWIIINPYNLLQIRHSAQSFADHPGTKIAVAGSYGKTTMKEILATVLNEGKKVAATVANKNVAISHAQFARSLKGDEEVLIIEFGEGTPGDVANFCRTTKPDIGVITGLAPAHLDKYKTLQRAGEDIFSLADFLGNKNVYVNGESKQLLPFVKKGHLIYSQKEVADWKISDIKVSISGLSFKMVKSGASLQINSHLLGEHQVGPLAAAASIASSLGFTKKQIEEGIARIQPFENRMQPREAGGAWIIDDTYNGNIEGMLAGLKLLKVLPAKRKIYVTPGLVDQGKESSTIHHRLGAAIAEAKPDLVVLMKHSVTDWITAGIRDKGYEGQLVIEEDPLNFYNHLDQFVAAGDLILLQNDWPDNYQ
ncbi:hypothetical protein HYW35_01205 [Candidatus Saccharibacteria bacterium]|nr:hypothetical protein [Candidatus Saccharibacteria bacterium]